MDAIVKALGDPARRTLLDQLRQKDGQTLQDLETALDMTRFGVMKHLRVLEDAHLITTRKSGRFKHHYLNPLPLQEALDRWINPFLRPQTEALSALKTALETKTMSEKPDFIMSTYIACSHDALWDALTQGDLMSRFHFACQKVTGALDAPGDQLDYHLDAGGIMLSNQVIAIDPKSRIEMDFRPNWGSEEPVSRCVYLLTDEPTGMKLTVEHYGLGPDAEGIADGWTRFLSGLKTWLETGKAERFAPDMSGAGAS